MASDLHDRPVTVGRTDTPTRPTRPAARPADPPLLFVGVGAPRSGTTWLAERLAEHPQVAMSPIKEMHWFDPSHRRFEKTFAQRCRVVLDAVERGESLSRGQTALLRRLALRNDDEYVRYLASWLGPGQTAYGEFTPSYSVLSEEGFGRIASLHEETRFLYVMRNPVSRAWSHYRRLVKVGQLDDGALSRGHLPDDLLRHLIRLSDYPTTLTRLWSVVPRERVFTCFYEDMTSLERGPRVLSRLWSFLGVRDVGSQPETFTTRTNWAERSDLDPDRRVELARTLGEVFAWVRSTFDEVPDAWEHDLRLSQT